MKHTGVEVICDLIEMNEENMAITIKDPQTVGMISQDENGAQMGFTPFLMNCKDDVIHLSLNDILFIAEADDHIAEQYTLAFGVDTPIITPHSKIIT
jgi:hypothetical protein